MPADIICESPVSVPNPEDPLNLRPTLRQKARRDRCGKWVCIRGDCLQRIYLKTGEKIGTAVLKTRHVTCFKENVEP